MFCVICEFCLVSVLLMFLLPLRDTLTPVVASAVFEFALGTFSTHHHVGSFSGVRIMLPNWARGMVLFSPCSMKSIPW